MISLFPGVVVFKEGLGRTRGKVIISALNDRGFYIELKKHLLSSEIDYVYHPEVNIGEIFVGGFRSVGVFERMGALNGKEN